MIGKRVGKIGLWFLGILVGICLLITGGLYFFKDEICGLVITEVNAHLKAKVTVSDVDLSFWGSFPNLSVDFNHVFIQDAFEEATSKDTLLYSDRIRLKFNPIDIYHKQYNVKGIHVYPGTIQLKVNIFGQVNYDIVKPSGDTTKTNFQLNLEKVLLEGVRFSYSNLATSQFYDAHVNDMALTGAFTQSQFTLNADTKLWVNHAKSGSVKLITGKPASFKLGIEVDQERGLFSIPQATIYIANLPFNVKGHVNPDSINFNLNSSRLNLADLATNLAMTEVQQIRQFEGSGNVNFDLKVTGARNTTEAAQVDCTFGIQGGNLKEPSKGLKLKGIYLDGRYSNKGGKTREYLKLSNVSFNTVGGPFKGQLLLTNFDAPLYQGKANGNINLAVIHTLWPIKEVEKVSGNVDVNSEFIVQTKLLENSRTSVDVQKCEGEVLMKNVNLKLPDDKRLFEKLNGLIYLRNNSIGMENVNLLIGASDVKIDGVFRNIVGFLKKTEKLQANVDIASRFIDMQDLGTETKEDKIQEARSYIMPMNVEGSVSLSVNDLKYESHHFRQISGTMSIADRVLNFPNVRLRNANADVVGAVRIEERSPEIFNIHAAVASNNIEFKPLFKEWNNFEQEVISEENIHGRAQVEMNFDAPFDLRSGILKSAIKSQIHVKISDGQLKNVSTFKSITQSLKDSKAKLILRKNNIDDFERRLLDLKFETLENTLIIQNGRLEIPQMLIKNNAMDVGLRGTHTFDNNIDYHFEFRLREIKRQKSQEEFGEVVDDESGVHLFLRMYGNLDNPIFAWDEQARKEQAKENREAAKQDAKSILKTEFGLFKNDTTVKTYQQAKKPKEELRMEFGPAKKEELPEIEKEPKKDSKIRNTLKGWKEQAEKEKKEEIDLFD